MPDGATVRPMDEERSETARVAAWRFAPLALIACALLLCWAMGWHRYLSLAWLADSRDMLRADVDANVLPIYDSTRIHANRAAEWILSSD